MWMWRQSNTEYTMKTIHTVIYHYKICIIFNLIKSETEYNIHVSSINAKKSLKTREWIMRCWFGRTWPILRGASEIILTIRGYGNNTTTNTNSINIIIYYYSRFPPWGKAIIRLDTSKRFNCGVSSKATRGQQHIMQSVWHQLENDILTVERIVMEASLCVRKLIWKAKCKIKHKNTRRSKSNKNWPEIIWAPTGQSKVLSSLGLCILNWKHFALFMLGMNQSHLTLLACLACQLWRITTANAQNWVLWLQPSSQAVGWWVESQGCMINASVRGFFLFIFLCL